MDTLDKQISFAHFLLLELRRQQSVFPEGVETSNALFVYSELRLCVSTGSPTRCMSEQTFDTNSRSGHDSYTLHTVNQPWPKCGRLQWKGMNISSLQKFLPNELRGFESSRLLFVDDFEGRGNWNIWTYHFISWCESVWTVQVRMCVDDVVRNIRAVLYNILHEDNF